LHFLGKRTLYRSAAVCHLCRTIVVRGGAQHHEPGDRSGNALHAHVLKAQGAQEGREQGNDGDAHQRTAAHGITFLIQLESGIRHGRSHRDRCREHQERDGQPTIDGLAIPIRLPIRRAVRLRQRLVARAKDPVRARLAEVESRLGVQDGARPFEEEAELRFDRAISQSSIWLASACVKIPAR
jgi:hypothetical protein